MIEWLTELLVQTCVCLLGFACGACFMRENYIHVIRQLNAEIESLTHSRRV